MTRVLLISMVLALNGAAGAGQSRLLAPLFRLLLATVRLTRDLQPLKLLTQ